LPPPDVELALNHGVHQADRQTLLRQDILFEQARPSRHGGVRHDPASRGSRETNPKQTLYGRAIGAKEFIH
jgi:hypothetical protein